MAWSVEKVITISLLGSFLAVTAAPLFLEAVLTAWTISWEVLFSRLGNWPVPLTSTLRASLEGGRALTGTWVGPVVPTATIAQVTGLVWGGVCWSYYY